MDRNGMSWMLTDNGAPFLSVLPGLYPFMLEPLFFRWYPLAVVLCHAAFGDNSGNVRFLLERIGTNTNG